MTDLFANSVWYLVAGLVCVAICWKLLKKHFPDVADTGGELARNKAKEFIRKWLK